MRLLIHNTIILVSVAGLAAALQPLAYADSQPFLPGPVQFASTVPANGDLNPYGVATVPWNFPTGGLLNPGDILVSNFNSSQNLQGTGTTIVQLRGGQQQLFYQSGGTITGLSGALAILSSGYVIVGAFPTTDGTCATVSAGSLVVLDKNANVVANWSAAAKINGPWGMTVDDEGEFARLFVSNALSGTVIRIDMWTLYGTVQIQRAVQIASGYSWRCDPAALVVGPTGLAYNKASGTLYVASTEDNAVYAVANAGFSLADQGVGTLIYSDTAHLHGPLELTTAPNGDLLVSDADVINSDPAQPSEIVEFTTAGQFVKQMSVNPNQGASFGVEVVVVNGSAQFSAVDDSANGLYVWTIPQ
jgi:hypothetical protein